jgi:hypothetical protein
MFVTSAVQVAVPGTSDLLLAINHQLQDALEVLIAQAIATSKLDLGLDPELGLAIWRLDVDMKPRLFARKEEEPEESIPKIVGLVSTTMANAAARAWSPTRSRRQMFSRNRSTRATSNSAASDTRPRRAISRCSAMDLTSSHFM